jgi:hypothetical protein
MLKRYALLFLMERRWRWLRLGIVTTTVFILLFLNLPGRLAPITSYADCAEAGYPISQTNPPACRIGNRTLLGPRTSESTPLPPQTMQTFTMLVQGDTRSDVPASQRIIRDQTTWESFWRTVHRAQNPAPPIITVDFARTDVIALTGGPKPTGGYNLKVSAVLVGSSGATINAIEQVPTITCPVTQAQSNRYFIASTAKLPQAVTFKTDTQRRRC